MSKITIKKKTSNFTIIDNTCLQDISLSWKAKGLLTYLLHLPDDWTIYLNDLKNRSSDGKDSTRSGLDELIKNKYIKRKSIRLNGRFNGYEYEVFEKPYQVGKTDTEKPTSEKPTSENPTILNTKDNKLLKEKNTNIYKDIKIFIETLNQLTGKKFKTIKSVEENIKQLYSEGYTKEDILTVINKMCKYWINTQYKNGLTPSKLFNPNKFDEWLNLDTGEKKEKTNNINMLI